MGEGIAGGTGNAVDEGGQGVARCKSSTRYCINSYCQYEYLVEAVIVRHPLFWWYLKMEIIGMIH